MIQQTAMQVLFTELEKLGEQYSEPFKEFHLTKERDIIVQTFNHGWNNGNLDADMTGSKYFTTTYKQP